MRTATGLDVLAHEGFARLKGRRIGLVCNGATVTHDYRHVLDRLLPMHRSGELTIAGVFGPQHGLFGHTQDNMIEWEGATDSRTGLAVHSLYGTHREPTDAMLKGIDLLEADVPDIGTRYYTFAWTVAHVMAAAARNGLPVMVLDRPNPIGGVQVEGTVLDPALASFVGLHPVPTRHGMTLGEVAAYVRDRFLPDLSLEIVDVEGWSRSDYLDDTDAPWAMPSPNMPTLDTAVVYPGGCLLEATNLSEGRGTTRPFEIFGAPFLDGWRLAEALNALEMTGVVFRPIQFEPTFNKHAGRVCGGCFVHVTDRRAFEPVLAYVAILQECIRQTGLLDSGDLAREARFRAGSAETEMEGFAWKQPPYEYEHDKMPIEILAGQFWLREAIEKLHPLRDVRERFMHECREFESLRRAAIRYPA